MTTRAAGPDGRRRRTIIAICIALLAAAVATVIIVVLSVGGSDDAAPDSPDAAATAWGTALLEHDSGTVKNLTCPGHSTASNNVYLITTQGSGVKVQSTTPKGHDSWDVGLTTTGPGGGDTLHVGVRKYGSKYYIC